MVRQLRFIWATEDLSTLIYSLFLNKNLFFKVLGKTKEIFGREFNEKLFREQLSYFEDIDYSEAIGFLPGFFAGNEVIKESLKEISLQK